MQALVELTRFLAKSQDIRDALSAVAACASTLVDARMSAVVLAEPGDSHGHLAGAGAAGASRGAGSSVDLSAHPEIQQVLDSGEILIISQFDPRRFIVDRAGVEAVFEP